MKYQVDPTSGPKDMFGQSPNVLDVGPALFARPRPSQVISTVAARQCVMLSMWAQVLTGTGHSEIQNSKVPLTKPLEAMTIPPQLANTLEHIVGQLDILTQVGKLYSLIALLLWDVCLDCIYSGGETHNNREQIKRMPW